MKNIALTMSFVLGLVACAGEQKKEAAKKAQGASNVSAETETKDPAHDGKTAEGKNDQQQEEGDQESGFALTQDEQDAVEAQVEEAIGGLGAESDDSGAVSQASTLFSFPRLKGSASAERDRTCSEETDGSVLVHVERSLEANAQFEGEKASAQGSVERSFKRDRKWSKDGETLHCNAAKNALMLPFNRDALDGLKLESSFSRVVERQASGEKDGKTAERSSRFEASGTRSYALEITSDESNLSVEHTISLDVKRKREITRNDGSKKVIESAVKTLEGEPIVIVRERSPGHVIADKVIYKSGRLGVLLRNGNRVEIEIDNVVVDRSKGVCARRSGMITGQITKAGETQPGKTFTIDFDQDKAEIVLANGDKKMIQPDICQ